MIISSGKKEPLELFLLKEKLFAFKHNGFWKSLDTLKDKNDFDIMIKRRKNPVESKKKLEKFWKNKKMTYNWTYWL